MSQADRERIARKWRDPDKQTELDAARGLPMNAEQSEESMGGFLQEMAESVDHGRRVRFAIQSEEVVPESAFERAMREGFELDPMAAKPPSGARVLSLDGPEMIAYVRVKAASAAAMAAQQAHQAAGAELRAALEAMCQLMAPPVK